MVKCKICGKLYGKITQSHLNTHGTSMNNYKKMNDEHKSIVLEINKCGDRICRVCGHPYKRLVKKHLHGMTLEEYDRLPPFGMDKDTATFVDDSGDLIEIDSASLDRLVPWIRDSMLKRGTLTEQARNTLGVLFESKEMEFKSMVTAMAIKKMERIPQLMDALDKLDKKLCDEEKIEKLTTGGAMQLLKLLSSEIDNVMNLFKDLGGMNPKVNLEQKNLINMFNIAPSENKEIPEDSYERDKLVKVYGVLTKLMDKVNGK